MQYKLKTLSYLMILFLLLTSSVYAAADTINSITGPATTKQGETVTLNIDYVASQERVLAVYLKTTTGVKKNYFYKRVTVQAGDAIKQITFTVPDDAPIDEIYKYGTYIAPLGKYWKYNLGKAYQYNVNVESATPLEDTVNSITGPAITKQGETVTLNIDYVASQERVLAVYLKTTTGVKKNYFYKRVTVQAGDAIKQITFTVPDDAPIDEIYKYGTYIAPLGKYWKYNLGKAYQYNVYVVSDVFKTIKTQHSPNEEVEVIVDVPLSGDQDWVGIYPIGDSSDWANVIAWNWVGQGNTVLNQNPKPMPTGEYEVRLFFHNSFIVEKTYRFTVSNSYANLGNYTPLLYSNNQEGDKRYITYYPEGGVSADMPVVIFIKGGGVSTTIEGYSGIMQFMASKGYYVIGVDADSYESWYITQKLEVALNEVKALHGLTVKKLAIMGHSLGGGQAFYAMKKFRADGYGNEGSLALSIDGWFAFNMDEIDLNILDSKVSFLQMNGVNGAGTDPRIHLKIWNLSTQAQRAFYTLPSTNHSYVAGNLANVLGKQDLLLTIGALTDDAFKGVEDGAAAIPATNKATYDDIFNALDAQDTYNNGDCKGVQSNAINTIKNNDINYCDLTPNIKKYPATTTLAARATDNTVVKPTLGTPTIDPIYQTRITMVDKPDESTSAYAKVQNWNADMRLLRIGNRIYDAKTLSETDITQGKTNDDAYNTLCSRASDYFRWSNKVPNKFYVINSSYELIQGKVVGDDVDCSNVLDTFSDYEVVHMGPHEGNIDYEDKYVVFVAKKPADDTLYVILYDLQTKIRVWTKTMPTQHWVWKTVNGSSFWAPSTLDWLSVSPSGKYIAFNNESNNTDGMYRYDINLTNKSKLQFDYEGTLYSVGGHGDIGYDTDGNEVYVQFMGGVGVYSFNLDNPVELGKKLLGSPYGGGHISCRNTKRPGWCYISANNDSNGNGLRSVFALKIDGTGAENVQNFSQSHIDTDYHDVYGSPTPDGRKVIFNSHWGTDTIGSFVVEAQ